MYFDYALEIRFKHMIVMKVETHSNYNYNKSNENQCNDRETCLETQNLHRKIQIKKKSRFVGTY